MNADGSSVRQVTDDPAGAFNPTWSPDGSSLAFQSWRDGNPEVYTERVDGTALRRLTTDPALDGAPRWMPDGHLVFTSMRDGGYALYRMKADGTDVVRVSHVLGSDLRSARMN
jgi:Tol biopolymer transport system component